MLARSLSLTGIRNFYWGKIISVIWGFIGGALLREIGGFREGYEGSQDHDLALRCAEKLHPPRSGISRVCFITGGWSKEAPRPRPKRSRTRRKQRGVRSQIICSAKMSEARWLPAPKIGNGIVLSTICRHPWPLVSIVIPTRDHVTLLQRCLTSIREKTDYAPIEIVIVDNGSTEPETHAFLRDLAQDANVHILTDPGEFNFSRLINRGARAARGQILAFVNNDVETEKSGWLREMVSHAVRPEVGAVGARLWYPDGRLQHAGVVLGLHGVASHAFQRFLPQPVAPMNRTFVLSQNYSAVTAACMVVRKTIFDDLGGFDENLPNNFNDVDFCLRAARARAGKLFGRPMPI